MSVSVLVRTTGEWSEVVGYAKLVVSSHLQSMKDYVSRLTG
jgi:hypothetical protein